MSTNHERRKSMRRKILDSFAFYVQVPKLGTARHKLDNLSETGLGFFIDSLGGTFTLKKDEILDIHFHLNPSLYLKLKVQVMREDLKDDLQEIGALLLETQSTPYQTYLNLVQFLDKLAEAGESA